MEMQPLYKPQGVEERWQRAWEEHGDFHADPASERPAYVIAVPPPNVTGALHMGHALNGTIQDALIRWHRMRGVNALWQPGYDHAGIATQAVVEKELRRQGTSRHEIGREAFVERGWIYRDNRIVNWCSDCRTSISDLEVEHLEVDDAMTYARYPLADGSGSVTIATVRPATILADVAVAVHPDDERYRDLVGREVLVPVTGRRVPIIADERVEPQFGTGAL